ncbi:hypothetical protein NL676_038189 [Syzygium grande]|nr:hypothetical protein NL676_038189 [Syzygium grande]
MAGAAPVAICRNKIKSIRRYLGTGARVSPLPVIAGFLNPFCPFTSREEEEEERRGALQKGSLALFCEPAFFALDRARWWDWRETGGSVREGGLARSQTDSTARRSDRTGTSPAGVGRPSPSREGARADGGGGPVPRRPLAVPLDLSLAAIFSCAAREPPSAFPAADSPAKDEGFVAARGFGVGVPPGGAGDTRVGSGRGWVLRGRIPRVSASGAPDGSGFLYGGGERSRVDGRYSFNVSRELFPLASVMCFVVLF